MSRSDNQVGQQAEQRTQETHSFMRQIRTATRRKYTPEERMPHRPRRIPPGDHG
jgi:hypothetical protein